jgi:chaperonin cofactor prefoldin
MGQKEKYEILFEDMSTKFDLIMEGHQITQRQAEENKKDTDQKLAELSSLLITSNKSLRKDLRDTEDRLSKRLDAVNNQSGSVENKVDRIEIKLDEHMRQPAHV